ncbi:MAG TPA: hypothetical protein VGD99_22600 [Anaerolineae bacterium]
MWREEITSQFSTLNEKPLHAALKVWYAQPDDQFEVPVDGFIIDIVRSNLLIEVQTGSFASIKPKLIDLTTRHPVRLVYPIAQEKWVVKLGQNEDEPISRRKSPKRGGLAHLCVELVSFPYLLSHPNFSVEALLIQEEETRRYDGRRGWRRKGWVTHERHLLRVVGQQLFTTPNDLTKLIPPTLTDPFTTADLAAALAIPRRLAQKMAYCLREMNEIAIAGKQGRAMLYTRTQTN